MSRFSSNLLTTAELWLRNSVTLYAIRWVWETKFSLATEFSSGGRIHTNQYPEMRSVERRSNVQPRKKAIYGSTSTVGSLWPISRTFQFKGLTNLINSRWVQKGPADEDCKMIKLSLQSHGLKIVFVCGATRVVRRCEDAGSHFTPWRQWILYHSYKTCTTCTFLMKPAILFILLLPC